MSFQASRSRMVPVLAAAAVVLLLGGLLSVRLMARDGGVVPPPGTVPPPQPFTVADFEVPCWSCPGAEDWPIRFRTDLDLLAPLGDGPANAAEFFVQFEKERGPRAAEGVAFRARRVKPTRAEDEWVGPVVPGDDPLLAEAEPWVDQATMRFYPDLLPITGANTRLTNLLLLLDMARSWTARGVAAADPAAGLADCRRAIRLGRLLRQEDAVLINDLVGLACIHIGTRGVYTIAQRTGDTKLALLASVVLGEVAPQRLYTSQRITSVDLGPFLSEPSPGTYALALPDSRLDAIVDLATAGPDRRFRGEGLLDLGVVEHYGTPAQQARARAVLDQVAAGDDPVTAPMARHCRNAEPDAGMLGQMIERFKK